MHIGPCVLERYHLLKERSGHGTRTCGCVTTGQTVCLLTQLFVPTQGFCLALCGMRQAACILLCMSVGMDAVFIAYF